jgi:DNA-binding IclR family transcriptional regulator
MASSSLSSSPNMVTAGPFGRAGYSVNHADSRRGVGAVGAAIKDQHGHAVGAVSVAFPLMPQYEDLGDVLPDKIMWIARQVAPLIT